MIPYLSDEEKIKIPDDELEIDDDRLVAMIGDEVSNVETDDFDLITQQRVASNLAYAHQGLEELRPTKGKSTVIANIIAPAVDTLAANQTRIFTSDKELVTFSATNPDFVGVAKQAQMMVNDVIFKQNNGYKVLSQGFKDAAINKNAIIKVTWTTEEESFAETYEGSDMGLQEVLRRKEEEGFTCDLTESEELEVGIMSDELGIEINTVKATIRCSRERSFPLIENIPPEEFMINDGATSINDSHLTRFVGHRKMVYRNDVAVMFPDVDVSDLSVGSEDLTDDYESTARHAFDGTYDTFDDYNSDPNMNMLELNESWIRADRNRDGVAEWRHCFTVGQTLLMDEEWFGPLPFASFTFFNVPHKFYGLSVFDRLRDYERTATGLLRGSVDATNQGNTIRLMADTRFFDHRSLSKGGDGVIPTRPGFDPSMIHQIQTVGTGGISSELISIILNFVQAEIGINITTNQISTDIEKSGNDAAKTSMALDNAGVKMEWYAREFADGCFKDLVWHILRLLVENKDSMFVKELATSSTPTLPVFALGEIGLSKVISKADLKSKVGLGQQTGAQKIQAANAVLPFLQALTVDPSDTNYNVTSELMRGMGYENPEEVLGPVTYFQQKAVEKQQMEQAALQQQQQAIQVEQQKLQLQQQQVLQDFQLKQQQQQFDQQIKQAESMAAIGLDQAKVQEIYEGIRIDTRNQELEEQTVQNAASLQVTAIL